MRLHPPLVLLVALAAGLVLLPATAAAQFRGGSGGLAAGLRGGRDFENHAWSTGGQVGLPLGSRLELRPSGDYYFGDTTPFRWQLNADAVVRLGPGRTVYGGGGAAFTRVRPLSETKTGYNLFFGFDLAPARSLSKPFVELRWTFVNDTSPFRLVFGFSRLLR
ncbi:MAG TPA: hypothetical protein VFS33_04605 [Gemmatimonadales bacterium]|nr:hypothetical protein [Gemmatimonadales bacterium]